MRPCPVCLHPDRTEVFHMSYRIPDLWTLPSEIVWYTCDNCRMIYGDGDFNQAMLDQYYRERYGYGVSNPDNIVRLRRDAAMIAATITDLNACIIDFGGAGDDGKSIVENELVSRFGRWNVKCTGPDETLPENCQVIYASHVLEHIYDLPQTMRRLADALAPDGLLIVDVPDATGLLQRWKMPILDFNTKHINHFTLLNLLELGAQYDFEAVYVKPYELEYAPCYQVHFKRLDVAAESRKHIAISTARKILVLGQTRGHINIWGLGDITWHMMACLKDLNVLNYIDNDPAYRGTTYNGKPVLERPDNDAPIVIMAQGQRGRLIENIRKAGVTNPIIEI
jgi:hypothetical protein